jgi:hypothetical protein
MKVYFKNCSSGEEVFNDLPVTATMDELLAIRQKFRPDDVGWMIVIDENSSELLFFSEPDSQYIIVELPIFVDGNICNRVPRKLSRQVIKRDWIDGKSIPKSQWASFIQTMPAVFTKDCISDLNLQPSEYYITG